METVGSALALIVCAGIIGALLLCVALVFVLPRWRRRTEAEIRRKEELSE
ncbi:hypothetical protein ACH4E8_19155 [Streptomyces sp. NPDC017979]